MAKAVVVAGEERSNAPQNGMTHQVTGLYTRTVDFLKDVRSEMRKVVTPSWAEVQSTTAVVLVTVFAFAGFFYVVDGVLTRVLQVVLHWLGSTQ